MAEANKSRYHTGDTLGDALRFLCDASYAVLPRDVAYKFGEFEKNLWGSVGWLAEEYGFCFGVERAVEMVEDALSQGATVRTLGPLIHNTQEIQRLESHGVATIEKPSDVEGEVTAVIRAHGVT